MRPGDNNPAPCHAVLTHDPYKGLVPGFSDRVRGHHDPGGGDRRRCRFVIQETNLYAHIRQHPVVTVQDANTNPDRCLVPVRRRDDRDDRRRYLHIRIGVERDRRRLSRKHPVYIGLVDIDLHLEGVHVHDGADARPRETAPGGNRRDHFAGLGGLGHHDPGERRANLHVRQHLALHVGMAFGDVQFLFDAGQPGCQALDRQRVAIKIRLAREFPLRETGGSREVQLRLPELHHHLVEARPRGTKLGLRQFELGPRDAVVELRQELSLLDVHALLHQDFHDLAGGLGTDRRLTPRHDIPRRIQHAVPGSSRRKLFHHCGSNLYRRCLDGQYPRERGESHAPDNRDQKQPLERTGGRRGSIRIPIDHEFRKKRFLVHPVILRLATRRCMRPVNRRVR